MDEKYIEMCIGLDTIEPNGWKPKYGDKFFNKTLKIVEHISTLPCLEFYESHPKGVDVVWLPRQDDIQERFDLSIPSLQIEFYRFTTGTARLVFSTFDQLWLAFYMLKKHGLKWDGKNWVLL